MFAVRDTSFNTCWTRTYDLDNIELYSIIVYNVCKMYFKNKVGD